MPFIILIIILICSLFALLINTLDLVTASIHLNKQGIKVAKSMILFTLIVDLCIGLWIYKSQQIPLQIKQQSTYSVHIVNDVAYIQKKDRMININKEYGVNVLNPDDEVEIVEYIKFYSGISYPINDEAKVISKCKTTN